MGMVMTARMLTPGEAAAALVSPLSLEALLYDEPSDPSRAVDLDKAWAGVSFLLTGPSTAPRRGLFRRRAPEPVVRGAETRAVLGGDLLGDGPARLLTAPEVDTVATALAPLTSTVLAGRYDAAALAAEEVYPQVWDEPDVFEVYLAPAYDSLRALYLRAAAEGASMLLAIS